VKVVACHHYLARRGPADLAFERDVALLERNGHVVIRLTFDNRDLRRRSRLGLVLDAVWNREFCGRLRDLVRRERPDVVHFHNTFPLISPAAYYAARAGGAAVVQTLHRSDLFCRTGALPKVQHACFRRPAAVGRIAATVLAVHRVIGTYRRAVDCYLATNELAREAYAGTGLPAGRIVVASIEAEYEWLMRAYEMAMRRRAEIAGRAPAIVLHPMSDPARLRRRAIAARWRPEVMPTETWVPMASNLAIVRTDAPRAFQAKVA
jgi:Glycosyl transferase 4-like domain